MGFCTVCGHLEYFFPFWYVLTKKNLANPVSKDRFHLARTLSQRSFGLISIATINFAIENCQPFVNNLPPSLEDLFTEQDPML
jgi:hypothetical protein